MGGLRYCETGVLEGVPNHHDNYLSDEEKAGQRDHDLLSGSKSPVLVLDL